MPDSLISRAGRSFVWLSGWTIVRLLLFVGAIFVAHSLPGAIKWVGWLVVFSLGVWTFIGLARTSRRFLDGAVSLAESRWERLGAWVLDYGFVWKLFGLVCCLILAGIAIARAWPSWYFLATSSLREDEILNIARYTSKGFAPAVGTYDFARNHIFFNVINSFIPWADSTSPIRGRLVSLIAVFSSLVLLVAYAGRRGWLLAGVASAGFVAVNLYALKVLLEGRGYGLICFFGVVGAISLAEWLRTRKHLWLYILAASCVLGTYTLPYYVFFGGLLLLTVFFHRPSRETFLAGTLSVAAIIMLYLPILNKVLEVAATYDEEYGDSVSFNFSTMDAGYRTLQYFLPYEVVKIGPLAFVIALTVALLFMMFGRFARLSDRRAAAGVAFGVLGTLAFLFFLASVPIRVSAFIAGPLAFLATVMAGSVMAARSLVPIRPLVLAGFTALAGYALWNAKSSEPLIPRQNWEEVSRVIEKAFPGKAPLWVGKKYGKLMQWYLPKNEVLVDDLDRDKLREGELMAFDAHFKGGLERFQFIWGEIPDTLRYVTFPLLVGYQRLFFAPPTARGVFRAELDGRQIPATYAGRQPLDPATLSYSAGDGDTLYSGDQAVSQPAIEPIGLPSTLLIELAPGAPRGVCDLLFSQTLADKKIAADVQDVKGGWHSVTPFVSGELVSVPLEKEGRLAVRLKLSADSGYVRGPETKGERPVFGLIDSWVSPRQDD